MLQLLLAQLTFNMYQSRPTESFISVKIFYLTPIFGTPNRKKEEALLGMKMKVHRFCKTWECHPQLLRFVDSRPNRDILCICTVY